MDPDDALSERIAEPAKLVRLAAMARQVLAELQHDGLDHAARERVHEAQTESIAELRGLLPDESCAELDRLMAPGLAAGSPPSSTDLRLVEAQLAGWLEGLLQGLEADEAVRRTGAELREVTELHRSSRGDPGKGDGGGYH